VLDPGVHPVTGNVTLNALGETVIVRFDKKKQYGSLDVGGTLTLGPDNAPTLVLDLSLIDDSIVGETFNIMQAIRIEGRFNGLGQGDMFEMGDIKMKINYTDTNIIVTVTAISNRWEPRKESNTESRIFRGIKVNPNEDMISVSCC
jgi:hypothetical protein